MSDSFDDGFILDLHLCSKLLRSFMFSEMFGLLLQDCRRISLGHKEKDGKLSSVSFFGDIPPDHPT